MSEPDLLITETAGVRTLTLNRPARKNAVTWQMWDALAEALRAAAEDRSVRVLVLAGAGGAFCSGADIGDSTSRDPIDKMRRFTEVATLLHELPKPTIAQVNGIAVGAGWNLALGCDLVVATPESKFSQIFGRRGLSPDLGGSWLLAKVVGLQQAKRLALLAETIDAAEAYRLNLVTWVVDAGEIDGFTTDLATRLAAGPPVASAQTKMMLNSAAASDFDTALENESRAQLVNFATTDPGEAYAAFAERREPNFTGQWAGPRQHSSPSEQQ